MANTKAKLDRSRPFATISSIKPQKAVFEQDGILFGQDDLQVGTVPGYKEKLEQKEAAEKAKVEAKEAKAKVRRAEELLGDLGDPNADARKENAAAEAAENLADDA